MEKWIIFRAGVKKHKGNLFCIFFLLFFAVLSLCTVLSVYLQGNQYIREEIRRTGFGTLTAWVSDVPDIGFLADSIREQEGVEAVATEKVIFSEYEANGIESDSEGQLFIWQPDSGKYHFFRDNLSGYQAEPETIGEEDIYVSPSMKSILHLEIGDTITFPVARNGKNVDFTVKGYYEDPVMGSSMIGMKGFLISETAYDRIAQMIEQEEINALAKNGAMLHITGDRSADLSVSELSRRLNEKTPLSQYTEFVHSADTMEGFMLILQNAFCGILFSFAVILLAVVFVVLGHSISGLVEQDWRNLGILKTIGMTGQKLVHLQVMQYMTGILPGLLLGILGAIPASGFIRQITVSTSGIWIPAGLPILPVAGIFILLLLSLAGFTIWRLRKIDAISPLRVIQGEEQIGRIKVKPPIRAKSLYCCLALRQLLSGGRRYVSVCVTAILLVFFTSLAGRMNDWLGKDGQGMMDAFNPADLDLGIQVLGELSFEEMEQKVQSYSEITDSYALAMPSVSVNGTNYTANVITEPERFHISRGKTCFLENEVVLTETLAMDLHVTIGDLITIRGDTGTRDFVVSGIYHCANDMGANLGMNREGYLSIGSDDTRLWCRHLFLADPSKKQMIMEALEAAYGGDVHIHENTWPGLSGIISAMHMLLIVMYALSAVFVCIVTVMTGARILREEQKDMGIYRSIGCQSEKLRQIFALRFGIMAGAGAFIGMFGAGYLTDPLVSAVMRMMGISNFKSSPSFAVIMVPGIFVISMFLFFAWLVSQKIKKQDMSVLTME